MKDITIIIPIRVYDNTVKDLLTKAIASVPSKTPIIMSCSNDAISDVQSDMSKNKSVSFEVNEDSSFTALVNKAVSKVTTKFFSILEFDDTYTSIWFDNVEKYLTFNPDVSIFMPLTDLYDFTTNKFIGYGNEAAWASSFSEEIGFIDNACLENFFDFYMTGSVFNTEDWNSIGGLKNSIKLSFWYEFLLRVTYYEKKIMVVPKVGYTHNLNRENSLINMYSETITPEESKKWIALAKQEQFFKEDRNKTINNNTEEDE